MARACHQRATRHPLAMRRIIRIVAGVALAMLAFGWIQSVGIHTATLEVGAWSRDIYHVVRGVWGK